MMTCYSLRKQVDKKLQDYKNLKARLKAEKEGLVILKTDSAHTEEAQNIIQVVSQTIQQQAHNKLAAVVTACLQEVFPDKDYEFEIKFEKKRKKTEAKLVLINEGHIIENPLAEDSGGICDIAAFVLRLSCLILKKPSVRKIMIMDEPFKNMDDQYMENVGKMLKKLSENFKIQFIIVTRIKDIMIGKTVKL